MKKIIFIADIFAEQYAGGGELNNQKLIQELSKKYLVEKINCKFVNKKFITDNKDNFFIIGNFIDLSEECKNDFLDKKYVIYEHDHKYVLTRNPATYKNFLADEKHIINKNFYKNAIAVFGQSKIHCETIRKNLLIENIINCSGNLWLDEHLDILEKYKNSDKIYDFGILQSSNPIKNTEEAVSYCKKNNLNYVLIPFTSFENYVKELSKCKNFIFFPKSLETLSRTAIEAKILGCKLIVNNLLGVASEEWLKKQSDEVLNYIKDNSKKIVKSVVDCIEQNDYQNHYMKFEKMPGVSIITSLYKAKKYIKSFLENITKQSAFDEYELILVDASPENEYEEIEPYLQKYENIKYIKLEKDPGIYGCWNIGIKESKHEYICNSNVDDLRNVDNLEILRKHLFFNKDIGLVYGDCCEINEIPVLNKNYPMKLSEHSIDKFSKENMIKCLPGPLPLWKKELHNYYGFFDEKYKSAGDWDYWLNLVNNDIKFKKIDTISGYYYNNPTGKSTNAEFAKQKFLEEKEIFLKYKNIFGKNYLVYKNWFERDV